MSDFFLNMGDGDADVQYKFINRGRHEFGPKHTEGIKNAVNEMRNLSLSCVEQNYLSKLGYFSDRYLEYLQNFRFNPDNVEITRKLNDGGMSIKIKGKLIDNILWEVPLMAIISEVYFSTDRDSVKFSKEVIEHYQKVESFAKHMTQDRLFFCEFGTRRRRGAAFQETAIDVLKDSLYFLGTSNVHLAMKNNIKPVGTVAHEVPMFYSSMYRADIVNQYVWPRWIDFHQGRFSTALTDTYTSDNFFQCFDWKMARMYNALRHDSGDPIEFTEKAVKYYENIGVDPSTKTIHYSDGLNLGACRRIDHECQKYHNIKRIYCVGTNLTNNIYGSPHLNIVIKLDKVNGKSVVKISDTPSKATGDPEEVKEVMALLKNKGV